MGSLLGGGKGGSTTTTSTKSLPSWLQDQVYNIRDQATALYNKPYESYTGQRIADLNTDQNQVIQGVRDLQGKYDPQLNQSQDALSGILAKAGQAPSAQDIQAYMNPYVNNVSDITKGRAIEDYTKQIQGIQNKAAAAGAFGGDRRFILEGQANQDITRNLSDIDYTGLKDAYDRALVTRTSDQQTGINSAQSLADLAKLRQGLDTSGLAALELQGDKQYGLSQQNLNNQYSDWQTEQAYPYEQLSYYNDIISPYANEFASSSTTQTQKASKGSGLSNILGTALSVGSMFVPGGQGVGLASLASSAGSGLSSLFGGSSGINWVDPATSFAGYSLYKEGGLVEEANKYASGGQVKSKYQLLNEEGAKFNPIKDMLENGKDSLMEGWKNLFGDKTPVKGNSYVPDVTPKKPQAGGMPSVPAEIAASIPDVTESKPTKDADVMSLFASQGPDSIEKMLISDSTSTKTESNGENSFGVNIPLLKAGIAILTSQNESDFVNIGKGLEAWIDTKTSLADKVKEDKYKEEDMDLKRMAKEAYAKQVEAYANSIASKGAGGVSKPATQAQIAAMVQKEVNGITKAQDSVMYDGPKLTPEQIQAKALANVNAYLGNAGGIGGSTQMPDAGIMGAMPEDSLNSGTPMAKGDIPIPAGPRGQFANVGAGQQPVQGNLQDSPEVMALVNKYDSGEINEAQLRNELKKLGVTF